VWADRWHGRALTTPRDVRNALIYVGSAPPVTAPETWLLRAGWRRHGLLTDEDCPHSG
jgi:hypothetical protein